MAEHADDTTWLVDMVIQLLNSPTWKEPINQFVLEHCVQFDNFQEENQHSFMKLHQDFANLVDSLLTAQLLEVDMDAEDFERQVLESGLVHDPRFRDEISKLTCAEDFVQFKDMMIAKHQELQMSAEAGLMEAAETERQARQAAEAMEMEEAAAVAAAHDQMEADRAAAQAVHVAQAGSADVAPEAAPPSPAAAAGPPKMPTAAEERSFTAAGGTYGRAAMPSGGKKVAQNDKAAAIRKAIAASSRPK